MSPQAPEDRDMLAAEYVLGLLDPPDDARARALAADDPSFAATVEAWRERFAELDITAPPGAAGADLLRRIEATLDAPAPEAPPKAALAPSREAATARVDTPVGRPEPKLAPAARGLRALWDSLGFWRGAGFAGAAASALLALVLVTAPLGRLPQPQFVAVLLGPQGEPAAVVNAFADGTAELIPLRTIPVPDGRVLEVWTLQDPARGPVSIGLIGEARSIRLDLKALPRTGPNQLFEITLEPKGGSPIGRPTGPILMKGTTSQAL